MYTADTIGELYMDLEARWSLSELMDGFIFPVKVS
jgi:hypothetical protein